MSEIRDVVIIGSGPAGYTAALYTARAQLKPLLFGSSIFVGGSLTTTTEVENFPGFPEGVDGRVLMENMRAQAEKFGAEMIDDDIVEVDLSGDIKLLTDSVGTVHRARTVIIATGSGYRKLGLHHEDELSGRGVSWCATCDGFFFRDRDIAVVGGGDTAMEEATFLTRFAKSVTVVHRRSALRASKVMQDRAFADDKISFAFDRTAQPDGLGRLTRPCRTTGGERVGGHGRQAGHDPGPHGVQRLGGRGEHVPDTGQRVQVGELPAAELVLLRVARGPGPGGDAEAQARRGATGRAGPCRRRP
ncbi:NAD(P)/FAD-dependent oxidoreductase [Streptomyces sp. NPDC001665]